MGTDATDAELVTAYVAGDRDAFGELWARHQRYVHAVVVHAQGGRAIDVEDVAQDVAVRVMGALPRWEGRSTYRSWLHRVTVNLTRDHLRRRLARPAVPIHLVHTTDIEDATAHDEAGHRAVEAQAVLDVVLAGLPARLVDVLVLIDHDGLSFREAATCLGVELGTVKSRTSRARDAARHLVTTTGGI